MRPSQVQMFVGDRRVAAGRVPRKFVNGIVIRIKKASLTEGVACFPCPFCEHTIVSNCSTACTSCEAEFDYLAGEQEVMFIASRNPQSPLV